MKNKMRATQNRPAVTLKLVAGLGLPWGFPWNWYGMTWKPWWIPVSLSVL